MAISAKDVKLLREKTGAGMMDCKKALTDTDGDFEKAVMFLREKGLAGIQKRAGKVAAEGHVAIEDEGNRTVLVEVNCETDFVAKNDDFKEFVSGIAKHVFANKTHNNIICDDAAAKLNDESWYKDNSIKVSDIIADKLATLGEKIILRRFASLESKDGSVATYSHGGGRIGVAVEYTSSNPEKLKDAVRDVAMHVAAINPSYLTSDEVTEDDLKRERELYLKQVIEQGKPEHIAQKIVDGKMKKFYSEVCLLQQAFVKEPSLSVEKFLNNCAKEHGTDITVKRFVRFQVGEGVSEE